MRLFSCHTVKDAVREAIARDSGRSIIVNFQFANGTHTPIFFEHPSVPTVLFAFCCEGNRSCTAHAVFFLRSFSPHAQPPVFLFIFFAYCLRLHLLASAERYSIFFSQQALVPCKRLVFFCRWHLLWAAAVTILLVCSCFLAAFSFPVFGFAFNSTDFLMMLLRVLGVSATYHFCICQGGLFLVFIRRFFWLFSGPRPFTFGTCVRNSAPRLHPRIPFMQVPVQHTLPSLLVPLGSLSVFPGFIDSGSCSFGRFSPVLPRLQSYFFSIDFFFFRLFSVFLSLNSAFWYVLIFFLCVPHPF